MEKVFIIIVSIFFSAKLVAGDYSIEDSSAQSFSSNGIFEVEITCFCSNNIKTKRIEGNEVRIEIEAKMDSVGYHGEQSKPNGISEELLKFTYYKTSERLELISNEYTFMHHAFIVKELTIYLPRNVHLRKIPLFYSMLEGRNNGE